MTQAHEPCVFCGDENVILDCQITVRGVLDADVTRCRQCGLLFVNPEPEDLHRHFNTVDVPLNSLSEKELCPGSAALEKINASLR